MVHADAYDKETKIGEPSPERSRIMYGPGTHGCHEALDRASYLAEQVDTLLAEHPAIRLVPEWLALANEAVDKLAVLYQKISYVHLDAVPRPKIKLPPSGEDDGRPG